MGIDSVSDLNQFAAQGLPHTYMAGEPMEARQVKAFNAGDADDHV